ncbi:MAG: glycosyltransferase involved in cell wall biosynthesis [Vicingaceae bacterium]|jgi:glycosyltransferase involved in cell wall biosynthesis
MQNKLISIVMPVKNAGLYLEECLTSIQNQSETNWELLAVNDNSTDNSLAILTNFSSLDSRMQVLQNKGQGIINALKTGYVKTTGELIHRMDADDLMPSEKLSLLKKELLRVGKGYVATGKVDYFAADGVNDGYLNYQNWLNNLCDKSTHWNELFKECVIASPNWMLYREDFERCGRFDSPIYPEDYDLVFRMYKAKLKVSSVKTVTHFWRDHDARSSRTDDNYAAYTFFEIKLTYFLELEYDSNRPLVVWGAGKKGKDLAKKLQALSIEFTWVSNNPNKHGKEIYDQMMESFESIATRNSPQIIITVALKNAKTEIIDFLEKLNLKEGSDFFFFS